MERQIIRIGSDNPVELRRLRDDVDEEFQEGATVTCTVYLDPEGTPVTNAQNLSMPQVVDTADRDVLYRGELPYTITFTARNYKSVVLAIAASGKRRRFTTYLRGED